MMGMDLSDGFMPTPGGGYPPLPGPAPGGGGGFGDVMKRVLGGVNIGMRGKNWGLNIGPGDGNDDEAIELLKKYLERRTGGTEEEPTFKITETATPARDPGPMPLPPTFGGAPPLGAAPFVGGTPQQFNSPW